MREAPHDPARARLEALWQEHAPAVVRYARRRVSPGEVDEVVAETFLVAWRRLDDVPAAPLPWLLGVARGVSANTRRGAARRRALSDRLTAESATKSPTEPAVDVGDGLDGPLAEVLAALRPHERELLVLLAWDGLTHAEAAVVLGISRATLAVRLHRLRRRVQSRLAGDDHPHEARWAAPLPLHGLGDPS